jgi:hypothetical protein
MKLFAGCLVVALFSLVPLSHAASCTKKTVAGNYGVATIGLTGSNPVVTLFLITFDGAGHFSGTGAENDNGTPSTGVTIKGTYSVTASCAFTLTATDSLGNTFDGSGNISQSGGEMVGVSTRPGSQLQFTAYQQSQTTCTGITPTTYAQQVQSPLTPYGPAISTAHQTLQASGKYSGSWVANFSGTVVTGTDTGTEVLNSNCSFTSTTIDSSSGKQSTYHYFGVKGLNGPASIAILVDSGWVRLSTSY